MAQPRKRFTTAAVARTLTNADGGHPGTELVMPRRRCTGEDLPDRKEAHNKSPEQARARVEHIFARMPSGPPVQCLGSVLDHGQHVCGTVLVEEGLVVFAAQHRPVDHDGGGTRSGRIIPCPLVRRL
ncbi:hypothetical protein SLAV_36945 [Streptomyces lavendulae subsp. lavendulae]|uniref:Uncharacterized protein n=1 Tax=Streptomyces lavendulae subsp. lavendulae TaxID=58340 RepID=A0A2K8PR06_STRLA|nr:hypothetical protein SLAV_36945 [Streptomyces lavendulae subsp. lavendulae]